MGVANLEARVKAVRERCAKLGYEGERQKCLELVDACTQITAEADPTFYIVAPNSQRMTFRSAESCLSIAPGAVLIFGTDIAVENARHQLLSSTKPQPSLPPLQPPAQKPLPPPVQPRAPLPLPPPAVPVPVREVPVPKFKTSKAPVLELFSDPATGALRMAVDGRAVESLSASARCGDRTEEVPLVKAADGYYYSGAVSLCDGGGNYSLENIILKDGADYSTLPYPDPLRRMRPLAGNEPLALNEAFQHVFAPRSRAQGEAELRRQCSTAPKEDSFLFVEGTGLDGARLSIWLENGFREQPENCRSSLDKALFEGMLSKFRSVSGLSMYHYHPKNGDKKYGSEFPSPTDLVAAISTAIDTLDNRYAFLDSVQDGRVVTEVGVFIIKPKYEVIRAEVEGARQAAQGFEADRRRFFDAVKGKDLSAAQRCALFAQMHTGRYLELKFEPS